jgi:phage tail protein X
MPIDTDFAFAHEHARGTAALAAAPAADFLGLLRGFVGHQPPNKPQRTWTGSGFNMIWRPNFDSEFGNKDFFLELNFTDETLSFTDITGKSGIANRGLLQRGIFLGGAAYLQQINDKFDNTGQHFEPGVWATVPSTTNPGEPTTVVRMGSIPHGTTINLQGQAISVVNQPPQFADASITPFQAGSVDDGKTNLVHFDEEDLTKPSTSRTDLARVASLTQAQLTNPNLLLSQAIAGQTISSMTVLTVTSDTSVQSSVPNVGGGIDNIAFLTGRGAPPAGGPNANVPIVQATFWIEQVRDGNGNEFLQLQYTQRVLLNFKELSWPHITVGTLVSQSLPMIYEVKSGDTLSGIALRYYGNGTEPVWRKIYDANRVLIGPDPNLIRPGERITLPVL